jgi:hydrogenase-4 component F
VGLPPFGLFVSEFLLVQAAIANGHLWLAVLVLLLLLAAFVSLVNHLNRMLYGDAPDTVRTGEPTTWPVMVLLAPVVILVLLGTVLPGSISALVRGSAALLRP